MNAAFINGVSSHIFDYDDTHLKTIIHPAGPVASAILALSEMQPVSGKDFLNALVLGVETECRIGNAVYPNHYDVGWHITGTAGVFGAAAAVGKLLGLSEQQMVWALGLAASQPVGLRESFGSMNKSFNPGRAASNGIFAAVLASKNYTSSDGMIEAKRGWANTISTKQDYREITEGLGQRYEAALNTYKPFACGIVLHPAIDAAIQLRGEQKFTADQVKRIELKVHPLVLELTGKKTPHEGLEGKFSIYHAVAVALIEGAGGEKQFSDRAVRDPAVIELRGKVVPVIDPAIKPEQVEMAIELNDGRVLRKRIEHAIGSLEKPMSDADLERKFSDLAEGIPAEAADGEGHGAVLEGRRPFRRRRNCADGIAAERLIDIRQPAPFREITALAALQARGTPSGPHSLQESFSSGIEIAGCAAFLGGGGPAKRAEHAVQRRIADAEPVLFTDEVMTQVVLLDPAPEPRSRLVGNVGDVMHPFIMKNRKHHSEQRGSGGLRPQYKREKPGGQGQVRHQKPDRQKQQIQPVRLDMVVVMEAVLQPARGRPCERRRMKGETMHAVFAQIEQQRAEQDRDGIQRQDAKQPGQRLNHHGHHERCNAAMAKKHEKHLRLPSDGLAVYPATTAMRWTRAFGRSIPERAHNRQS